MLPSIDYSDLFGYPDYFLSGISGYLLPSDTSEFLLIMFMKLGWTCSPLESYDYELFELYDMSDLIRLLNFHVLKRFLLIFRFLWLLSIVFICYSTFLSCLAYFRTRQHLAKTLWICLLNRTLNENLFWRLLWRCT